MIRHETMARAILAVTGGMHRAPTIGRLVSCPSFPLVLAAGLLRAVSAAVHLAPIAALTDKRLASAPGTKKASTRGFRCPVVFPYDICVQLRVFLARSSWAQATLSGLSLPVKRLLAELSGLPRWVHKASSRPLRSASRIGRSATGAGPSSWTRTIRRSGHQTASHTPVYGE